MSMIPMSRMIFRNEEALAKPTVWMNLSKVVKTPFAVPGPFIVKVLSE